MAMHEKDKVALWDYVEIVPGCNKALGKDSLDKLTKQEMTRYPAFGQLC